jgi:hypothetical protein
MAAMRKFSLALGLMAANNKLLGVNILNVIQ